MDSQAFEGNWSARPITGTTRQIPTIGLDAVTVEPGTLDPYFFLFCDIDTKEPTLLRDVLQKFSRVGISVYFWETVHGWHAISPALLKLRVWTSLRLGLQDMIQFYFDTLRWSTRLGDGYLLYFEDYSKGKYRESLTLHQAISSKFGTVPLNRGIPTRLTWSRYYQLRFKHNTFKDKFSRWIVMSNQLSSGSPTGQMVEHDSFCGTKDDSRMRGVYPRVKKFFDE